MLLLFIFLCLAATLLIVKSLAFEDALESCLAGYVVFHAVIVFAQTGAALVGQFSLGGSLLNASGISSAGVLNVECRQRVDLQAKEAP